MNRELSILVRKTVTELAERNALPFGETKAADRRYTADYLVKKSPFAMYFEYLGITKGCQIKRSFDYIRSGEYFKFIYQLYCMKWVYEYDNELVPSMDAFDVLDVLASTEKNLRLHMEDIKHEFYAMLKRMQEARDVSMGRREVYKLQKANDSELLQYYCGMSERALLGRLPFISGSDIPAAALAILFHSIADMPAAKAWIDRHKDEIIHWFVRNAAWRCYLALFHNVALLDDEDSNLQRYYASDGFVEKLTGGISHRRLNWQAAHYQFGLLRALRCIKSVAPFPIWTTEDPTKEMYEEEELYTSGTITTADIPEQVKALAQQLSKIHGPVQVTSEASGMHLYIADPELLLKDGEKELSSRHMAINVDKYFGLGKWDVDEYPTKENQTLYKKYRMEGKEVPCCMSMKTSKPSSVSYLLSLPPVEQRINTTRTIQANVFSSSTNKNLVYDSKGNLVPAGPGSIIPLSELPDKHPAREYLQQRGYNPDLLGQEYSVGYCNMAAVEDRAKGVYWSRLPSGVKNSPAGRIIFPMLDADGVRRGWQARAIEYKSPSERWLWTDSEGWLQLEQNDKDLHVSKYFPDGFKKLHKYINAKGMARNEVMFGLYQAVNYFRDDVPWADRYCILMEGALDVAKGGPPCIALLGKSMSQSQAEQIQKHFGKVYVVADQDEAGHSMLKSVAKHLRNTHQIIELLLPEGKKDLGDCTYEEAAAVLASVVVHTD